MAEETEVEEVEEASSVLLLQATKTNKPQMIKNV